MRYLDITTYKQSLTKDSDNCYQETDERVAPWFNTPIGFDVKEVLGDFPLLKEISPINEDGTVNTHKRAILDSLATKEDGSYYNYYLTTVDVDGIHQPNLVKIQDDIDAQALEDWKASRAEAVSEIVVEVNGKKFDGDEQSQIRMGRTWVLMEDLSTTQWSLADSASGVMTEVTKEELKEACRLAGLEQTALWEYK